MAKQKTEAQIDRYNRFGSLGQWLAATVIGTISAGSTFINIVRTKFHDDSEFRQGFAIMNDVKNLELQQLNDNQIAASMEILEKHLGHEPVFQQFSASRMKLNQWGDFREIKRILSGEVKVSHEAKFDINMALRNYTKDHQEFQEKCKDGIDRARRSPEYKKLAYESGKKMGKLKGMYDSLFDGYAETMYGIKSKGILGHTQGAWERFLGFGGYTKRDMIFKTAVASGVGFFGTLMAFNQLNTRDKLNEIDKQSERVDRKLDALMSKAGVGEHEIETRAEHQAHVRAREKLEDKAIKSGKHISQVKESGGYAAKVRESRSEAEASADLAV